MKNISATEISNYRKDSRRSLASRKQREYAAINHAYERMRALKPQRLIQLVATVAATTLAAHAAYI
jgi:hypothetical protein